MAMPFSINDRKIGPGHECYIIAEMSANHGQSYEQAVEIVQAAKAAGADAVKLQTYTPATLTIDCAKEYFQIGEGSLWQGKSLYELYGEAYTPWEWQPKLKAVANDLGLDCFSTPFDYSAVDFLEAMDVPAYKIASFEIVDLPLIRRIAITKKPAIMSTGMASLAEIDDAVRTFREAGNTQLALLKCTSAYPSLPEGINLRTIEHMAEAFEVVTGLSDHTLGAAVPIGAVALGACIIEKHLTLSRKSPGPDAAFSMEPDEFRAMVEGVRTIQKAFGKVSYELTAQEEASKKFRRSLFVVEDVAAGEPFTEGTVRSIRPGYGISPKHIGLILGRPARRSISRGTPLTFDLIG